MPPGERESGVASTPWAVSRRALTAEETEVVAWARQWDDHEAFCRLQHQAHTAITRELMLLPGEIEKAGHARGEILRSGLSQLTVELTEAQAQLGMLRLMREQVEAWRERLEAWAQHDSLEKRCDNIVEQSKELEVGTQDPKVSSQTQPSGGPPSPPLPWYYLPSLAQGGTSFPSPGITCLCLARVSYNYNGIFDGQSYIDRRRFWIWRTSVLTAVPPWSSVPTAKPLNKSYRGYKPASTNVNPPYGTSAGGIDGF